MGRPFGSKDKHPRARRQTATEIGPGADTSPPATVLAQETPPTVTTSTDTQTASTDTVTLAPTSTTLADGPAVADVTYHFTALRELPFDEDLMAKGCMPSGFIVTSREPGTKHVSYRTGNGMERRDGILVVKLTHDLWGGNLRKPLCSSPAYACDIAEIHSKGTTADKVLGLYME